ncbi:hypothetical protein SAMN05216371_5231 [Streptomyces sp. TLI_053]|nr:hypothetical protein SAMN05216371_5231 [Streptomyces sp. TLI_053]
MTGGLSPARTTPLSVIRAEKVPPTMSTAAALPVLNLLASEGEGGNHDSLNPYLTGGAAFFVLLLLLFITTRFNRDR